MSVNIDGLIKKISDTVKTHKLKNEGEYARWLWQDEENSRKLGINEYGCADAVNILYSIGEFPSESESRNAHINALQNMQNHDTGLFTEETHHFIHTTAHCTAALELFDAKPRYPFAGLEKYMTVEGVTELLEGLGWGTNPWPMSHRGAGIYAALVLTDSVDEEWKNAYFKWLWENTDPETGLWRKGYVTESGIPVYNSLNSTFHYLFNHEYAHKPLRYPEKVVDTCIELYESGKLDDTFGRKVAFSEIDWVYCLARASRQTPHRFEDGRRALKEFAVDFINYLESLDEKTHDGFNDLHMLFGAVCCLAEMQQALPGMIESKKPLKLVLDRRPFI